MKTYILLDQTFQILTSLRLPKRLLLTSLLRRYYQSGTWNCGTFLCHSFHHRYWLLYITKVAVRFEVTTPLRKSFRQNDWIRNNLLKITSFSLIFIIIIFYSPGHPSWGSRGPGSTATNVSLCITLPSNIPRVSRGLLPFMLFCVTQYK